MIDWKVFSETRSMLGDNFARILGYFREDGIKSVAAIESALRENSSAKLVIPAHTLKSEAWQFGAVKLGLLAENIEMTARHFVEIQQTPEELLSDVVKLRELFETSLAAFDAEANPLVSRQQNSPRTAIFGLSSH
ncbi:histidine phosphotransferase [Sphingorhabdus lutea]|uniref:Histidine phosphotransferase n=1 Tax=Sphingorhabdus lutea TaxID=1913578 RepID=A0A1L3JEA6_9SPHN|nr:histidine phosphotransferase [Sphingorhabdus lutea]